MIQQQLLLAKNVVSIYKIKEYPSLEHTINIDNEIQKNILQRPVHRSCS